MEKGPRRAHTSTRSAGGGILVPRTVFVGSRPKRFCPYAYRRNFVCLSLGAREAPGHPDIRSECRRTILARVQPFPAKGCRPRNTPAFGFIVIIVSNCQHAGCPEICPLPWLSSWIKIIFVFTRTNELGD